MKKDKNQTVSFTEDKPERLNGKDEPNDADLQLPDNMSSINSIGDSSRKKKGAPIGDTKTSYYVRD